MQINLLMKPSSKPFRNFISTSSLSSNTIRENETNSSQENSLNTLINDIVK